MNATTVLLYSGQSRIPLDLKSLTQSKLRFGHTLRAEYQNASLYLVTIGDILPLGESEVLFASDEGVWF